MDTSDAKFEPTYTPPLAGGTLSGEGKWIKSDSGYTWTDGKHVNFLDFNNNQALQDFTGLRTQYAQKGYSAEQAFNAFVEIEQDSNPDNKVESGDLENLSSEYEKIVTTKKPITAAAATPEDRAPDATIYILVDDDGTTVLDLMKTDANGYYVRDNETWQALDPDADEESDPQYFDKDWIKVNADAIETYDDDVTKNDTLNKDDFSKYIIPWPV